MLLCLVYHKQDDLNNILKEKNCIYSYKINFLILWINECIQQKFFSIKTKKLLYFTNPEMNNKPKPK